MSQKTLICISLLSILLPSTFSNPTLGDVTRKTIIVTLKEGTHTVLSRLETRAFVTRKERVGFVTQALQDHAAQSQKGVVQVIERRIAEMRSTEGVAGKMPSMIPLWISNQIILENADEALIHQLETRDDVVKIEGSMIIPMLEHTTPNSVVENGGNLVADIAPQWGVDLINAPEVWSTGNKGEGVVVAIIDTGVNGEHEALKGSYVGNDKFGWFDPDGKKPDPWGGHFHGSHCAGIIAGANGIGVAPGAKWSACKSTNAAEQLPTSLLLQCGQWSLCPSGDPKDCHAPHIVSNSWGRSITDTYYDKVIDAWRAAGIIPIFAIGNSGPWCGSAGSPGDNPNVIAVGNTNSLDEVYVSLVDGDSSSVGPSQRAEATPTQAKPDIAAPGFKILSATNHTRTSYMRATGSSMACPHVAGAVALLMASKGGHLTYDQVLEALIEGAEVTQPSMEIEEQLCGDKSAKDFPNNYVGNGRIDVLKSVNWLHGQTVA